MTKLLQVMLFDLRISKTPQASKFNYAIQRPIINIQSDGIVSIQFTFVANASLTFSLSFFPVFSILPLCVSVLLQPEVLQLFHSFGNCLLYNSIPVLTNSIPIPGSIQLQTVFCQKESDSTMKIENKSYHILDDCLCVFIHCYDWFFIFILNL